MNFQSTSAFFQAIIENHPCIVCFCYAGNEFADYFYEKGTLNEVEMFQRDVIISRGALIDATEWLTDLPKKSK